MSATPKKSNRFVYEDVQPYGQEVALDDLLKEIEAVISDHVVLSAEAAKALAAWVVHTYVFEVRDAVAYVAIQSPEKRCGKTTLLSVLAALCHKPLVASNVTIGALFRSIDEATPTLLIDEADTFLGKSSAMRGILNCGNTRRTAYVLRLSTRRDYTPPSEEAAVQTGANVVRYSCWCPKVVAMIGRVPETLADRSIVVNLERKLTSERCKPLSELNVSHLKQKCVRWKMDNLEAVRAWPRTAKT